MTSDLLERKLKCAVERADEVEVKIWNIFLRYCSHSTNPEEWEELLGVLEKTAKRRNLDFDEILTKLKD